MKSTEYEKERALSEFLRIDIDCIKCDEPTICEIYDNTDTELFDDSVSDEVKQIFRTPYGTYRLYDINDKRDALTRIFDTKMDNSYSEFVNDFGEKITSTDEWKDIWNSDFIFDEDIIKNEITDGMTSYEKESFLAQIDNVVKYAREQCDEDVLFNALDREKFVDAMFGHSKLFLSSDNEEHTCMHISGSVDNITIIYIYKVDDLSFDISKEKTKENEQERE